MPTDVAPPAVPVTGGRLVSADTLVVAPAIVGQRLAEPWRRLAGIAADLTAIAALSLLSRPWLGLATGVMLLVLFGNSRMAPLPQKIVRFFCRGVGALLVLVSALALTQVPFLRTTALKLDVFTGRADSPAMRENVFISLEPTTSELRAATARLQEQVADLKKEVREWQRSSRSWQHQVRTFTLALGITFGWSGVYFTLLAGALGGRTPGKLLFRTGAVKISGQPFTFFDAFVRHGGYVAGVAMGLLGFLNVLWDANRRAVQDRIAGTVVLKHGR